MKILLLFVAFLGVSAQELISQSKYSCSYADLMNRHMPDTHIWLVYLRGGTDQYDAFLGYLREEIRNSKGKLSLAKIGTSESELKQLRVKGSKIIPKKGLPKLACSYDDKGF